MSFNSKYVVFIYYRLEIPLIIHVAKNTIQNTFIIQRLKWDKRNIDNEQFRSAVQNRSESNIPIESGYFLVIHAHLMYAKIYLDMICIILYNNNLW